MLAAGAALLFIAGCGDERKEFREDTLAPLQQAVKDQRARIAATLNGLRLGDRERALQLERDVEGLVAIHEEIAGLDPPDGTEGLFETYTEANQRLSDRLRRYAALVKSRKRDELKQAARAARDAAGETDLARVDLDLVLRRGD